MSRISTPATIDAAHFCDRNAALSRASMIAAALATATVPALAQDADDEINPAPAAIGADVPATYFGPPPSSVEGRVLINAIRTTRIWPMVAGSPRYYEPTSAGQ
jgi:hypothetical protein